MGDRRNKGGFSRIQFFEFRNILQKNDIPQPMRFTLPNTGIINRNIGSLEITFFIVGIYL